MTIIAAIAMGEGPSHEFGRFNLFERIGAGGMGEVFRAEMRGPDGFSRTVVVKRMLPDLTQEPDAIDMFVHEAKLAGRLVHPNVVQVYDFAKIGSRYYLVMEYVAGCDLHRLLSYQRDSGRRLPPNAAVTITAALLEGLAFAHALSGADGEPLGVVHRDVAPSNVLSAPPAIALRFRHREDPRAPRAYARRRGQRQVPLHVAGAGAREPEPRRAQRPVRRRRDALRDAHRQAPVRSEDRPGGDGPHQQGAVRQARGRRRRVEGGRRARVADPSRRSLPDRARVSRGSCSRAARDGGHRIPSYCGRSSPKRRRASRRRTCATRRDRPAAPRQPTEAIEGTNAPTEPAAVALPTPAAVVSLPSVPPNTVSVVVRPRHLIIGGIALVALVALTFAIAMRFNKAAPRPAVLRVALRMFPAQAQWFKQQVFEPFAEQHNCTVELVEFNSTEELTRILANGEADLAKVDIEHAPVLVELGQLQRLSVLGERVDAEAYKQLLSALRPRRYGSAGSARRSPTTVPSLPRKLETAVVPAAAEPAVREMPKQRRRSTRGCEITGHGLPDGFELPRPCRMDDVGRRRGVAVQRTRRSAGALTRTRWSRSVLMEAFRRRARRRSGHVSPALVDVLRVRGHARARRVRATSHPGRRFHEAASYREPGLGAFIQVQIDVGLFVGNGHGLPKMIDDPNDWNAAPLPRLIGLERAGAVPASESRSEVWGWGWGVPRNSREPELAMRLIMSILSRDRHGAELEELPILRCNDVAPVRSWSRGAQRGGRLPARA